MIFLAIGIGATTFFLNNLDRMIASTIETEGTSTLGTLVKVDSVSTDLRAGSATIRGLKIANHDGFTSDTALEIPVFNASVDYRTKVVKEILIDNPIINAELLGSKNNFQALLDNMPETGDESTSESADTEISLTINKLVLSRSTVNVTAKELDVENRSFIMSDLEMTNLSGTVDELSDEIVRRLTRHISDQIKSFATAELKSRVTDELKQRANEELENALDGKLGDKLKGLKLNLGD